MAQPFHAISGGKFPEVTRAGRYRAGRYRARRISGAEDIGREGWAGWRVAVLVLLSKLESAATEKIVLRQIRLSRRFPRPSVLSRRLRLSVFVSDERSAFTLHCLLWASARWRLVVGHREEGCYLAFSKVNHSRFIRSVSFERVGSAERKTSTRACLPLTLLTSV